MGTSLATLFPTEFKVYHELPCVKPSLFISSLKQEFVMRHNSMYHVIHLYVLTATKEKAVGSVGLLFFWKS